MQAMVPKNRSTMARRMTRKQATEVGPVPASDKRTPIEAVRAAEGENLRYGFGAMARCLR
jgi:hypothetical protein